MQKKYLAFGDIHGCALAAERAVMLSEELNATAIFLGDYVDRGPASMSVLEVLINACENHHDWIFLRGNHDQMLMDLINGQRQPEGFDERTEKEAYAEWINATTDLKDNIVVFLNETLHYFETDQMIFVHAPLKNTGVAFHLKTADELIWNYDLEPIWKGKPFVHGHLPIEEVSFSGQGININTSCGFGGKLTGILIDANSQEINSTYSITEDGHLIN